MSAPTAKAEATVAKACRWVAKNPDTWWRLRSMCWRLMRQGELIQRDNVYTLACQAGMTVSDAGEFKRDHNLWSVLSRYMVMLRPQLLAAIRFRASAVDDVDLVGVWEAVVGPTTFKAGSLVEAQAAYEGARQ